MHALGIAETPGKVRGVVFIFLVLFATLAAAQDKLCGTVIDENGSPLPWVHITVSPPDPAPQFWVAPNAWTDTAGGYCLEGLQAFHTYEVAAAKRDYATAYHPVAMGSGRTEAPQIILAVEVGLLSDPRHIEFEGNHSVTDDEIREGLLHSSAFLLASHPRAPRRDLVTTVERKILHGYRDFGFPDAKVTAALSEDRTKILVKIAEGELFRKDKVIIRGLDAKTQSKLLEALTKREYTAERLARVNFGSLPSFSNSTWTPGDEASFDNSGQCIFAEMVETAFANLGYWNPKYDAACKRYEKGHTVGLEIKVTELGPKAKIDSVEITGNSRNRSDVIERYLQIGRGSEAGQGDEISLRQKLLNSGRFRQATVELKPVEDRPGALAAKIEVKEDPDVATLDQPMSDLQGPMQRVCDWISRTAERGEEISMLFEHRKVPGARMRLVTSGQGVAFAFDTEDQGSPAAHQAIYISRGLAGIYTEGHPELTRLYRSNRKSEGALSVRLTLGDEAEGDAGIKLNVAMQGKGVALQPFDFRIVANPVFCMRLIKGAKIEHGLIKADFKGTKLEASAETGALKTFVTSKENETFEIRITKGAYDELTKQTAPIASDPSPRLSDWTAVLGDSILENQTAAIYLPHMPQERRLRAAKALRKLVISTLRPIDGWHIPFIPRFDIPPDDSANQAEALMSQLQVQAATILYSNARELFSEDAWPNTLMREAVYVLSNQGRYTGMELQRVYDSERVGPIGMLAFASALRAIQSPYAKSFADKGLNEIAVTDLQKDLALLTAGNGKLPLIVQGAVQAIREMSPDEVDALLELLPAPQRPVAASIAKEIRGSASKPLEEVLATVMTESWERGLQKKIIEELSKLAVDSTTQTAEK